MPGSPPSRLTSFAGLPRKGGGERSKRMQSGPLRLPRNPRSGAARERDLREAAGSDRARDDRAAAGRSISPASIRNSVTSRAALAEAAAAAQIRSAARCRAETPPFGGFNVTPPGKAKRLLMSPGPIFEPEGHGKDFAGVARAMFAAGFRDGHIVLNCFSYHLTPGAWMFESAARGARLRGDPGRRRQYRAAGRGDRAASSPTAIPARRIS